MKLARGSMSQGVGGVRLLRPNFRHGGVPLMFNSLRSIRKPMVVYVGAAVVLLALLGVIAGCEEWRGGRGTNGGRGADAGPGVEPWGYGSSVC